MGKTGKNEYECKSCGEKFQSIQSVLTHELKHVTGVDSDSDMEDNQKSMKRAQKPLNVGTKKKRKTKHFDETPPPDIQELENVATKGLTRCLEGTELHVLCKIFQPDPENLTFVYERIVHDLDLVLNPYAKKFDILPFGSTITGMAFKSSDMDFYLHPQDEIFNFRKEFREVLESIRGGGYFTDIVPIPRARVPIIKCTHKNTGYNLDVNVASRIGVYNSRFIAKLFLFDARIHPLMLVIKIWAKARGITRTGRMTNYCLILLVIFYLQNCDNPVVPPIKMLVAPVKKKNFIDGINFSFNDSYKLATQNTDNIKTLIEGFFKFYHEYKFDKFIVCPYLGRPIARLDIGIEPFYEYKQQLKVMKEYVEKQEPAKAHPELTDTPLYCNSDIVVQDPFCLNQNKSLAVRGGLFQHFKRKVEHGYNICTSSTKREQKAGELLVRLFYESRFSPQSTSRVHILEKSKADKSSHCRICPVETELFFVRMYLRKKYPEKSFDKLEINKLWAENIVEFTKELLSNIFKVSMSSTNGNEQNKYTINCNLEAPKDIWSGRKQDNKKGYEAFLKEQLEISEIMLKERSSVANIQCKLALIADADYSGVNIRMEDKADKNTKSHFPIFFNEFISRMRAFYKAYFERFAKGV